jgi:hypothetical protein
VYAEIKIENTKTEGLNYNMGGVRASKGISREMGQRINTMKGV